MTPYVIQMSEFFHRPDCVTQAYRTDILDDYLFVNANATYEAEFLWILRPYGSDVVLLGEGEKQSERAMALLDNQRMHREAFELYHLSKGQVKRVNHQQAQDLAMKKVFSIDPLNHAIKELDTVLCYFDVSIARQDNHLHASVKYMPRKLGQIYTAHQEQMLRALAVSVAVKAASTFCVTVIDVRLDGVDLLTKDVARPFAWSGAIPSKQDGKESVALHTNQLDDGRADFQLVA